MVIGVGNLMLILTGVAFVIVMLPGIFSGGGREILVPVASAEGALIRIKIIQNVVEGDLELSEEVLQVRAIDIALPVIFGAIAAGNFDAGRDKFVSVTFLYNDASRRVILALP